MFHVIIILGLFLLNANSTSAFVAVSDGIIGVYNHPRLSVRRSTTSSSSSSNNNNDTIHKTEPSPPTPKPSIAILGSGAVGCYYGSRLWETQRFDVRFYMRGEHLEVCRRKGLRVDSIEGDVFLPPEEMARIAYGTVEDIGTVDWVLLCLKSTALGAGGGGQQQWRSDREGTKGEEESVIGGGNKVRSLLLPLLHKQTRIIAVMNGMVDDDLVRLLEDDNHDHDSYVGTTAVPTTPNLTKCAATYAGMAFICSNRISPGHVVHSYAGGLSVGLVASSSSLNSNNSSNHNNDRNEAVAQEHQDAVIDLFRTVRGFSLTYEPNVVRARWSKMLWNLPFNGISVAMGGITIDRVVQDPGLREMAYTVMDETLSIANGDLVSRGFGNEYFLGRVEQERMMYLSDHMGEYSTSTMLDLVNRRPMEVYYLFEKALERADELGIPVPVLRTLTMLIMAHQSRFNLF